MSDEAQKVWELRLCASKWEHTMHFQGLFDKKVKHYSISDNFDVLEGVWYRKNLIASYKVTIHLKQDVGHYSRKRTSLQLRASSAQQMLGYSDIKKIRNNKTLPLW
jgi:hypothetical protein